MIVLHFLLMFGAAWLFVFYLDCYKRNLYTEVLTPQQGMTINAATVIFNLGMIAIHFAGL